jgi:heptosyltransferase-2
MASKPQRILVIRFSSLGDVILMSALLDALRISHPNAEIWLATKTRYAELFTSDPRVDRVVGLDTASGALGRLVGQLEKQRFDLILDAHKSLRSRLLTWRLPPAPVRRVRKDTAARLIYLWTRRRSRALGRHQIDRYLELLEGDTLFRPSLMLDDVDRTLARAALSGMEKPVLAMAPGSRHATKQWPADRFTELAHRFLETNLGEIVLMGGPGEEGVCSDVAGQLEGPVRVSCGDLPLMGSAALLERCEMLVCNDSGLMHMAEAVGTPVLALFGPTSRELGYFPRDPGSRVIEHALDCRPCSRNGAAPCKLTEQFCMTRSTVDLVFSHLESRWRRIQYQKRAASM